MEHVFIVGIARTGSKIYMSALNEHTDIDVVTEMHYLAPQYVRRDAVSTLELAAAPLTTESRIQEAVATMYSGEVKGTFWEKKAQTKKLQQRLVDMDRLAIVERIRRSRGTPEAVFRALLEEHAKVAHKHRAGAKFPVDISCVGELREWFPDAKLLHLIRDPRAIYASMVTREFARVKMPAKRKLAAFRRLPYLILQFKRAAQLHQQLQGTPNYYLSRFEDTVREPERHLRQLCEFLEVDYNAGMLTLRQVDSSYGSRPKRIGMDEEAVNRWRSHLLPIERKILDISLKTEMQLFGYSVQP